MYYDEGKGIAQCHNETIKWWCRAAEQGKSCAQFLFGLSDEQGDDVEGDIKEALKWTQKAATQGEEVAKERMHALWSGNDM